MIGAKVALTAVSEAPISTSQRSGSGTAVQPCQATAWWGPGVAVRVDGGGFDVVAGAGAAGFGAVG